MTYDEWLTTDPNEAENEKFDSQFDAWLDTLNSEDVANAIKMKPNDLLCFASDLDILPDDEDVLVSNLIDEFTYELEEYFRNNIWEM